MKMKKFLGGIVLFLFLFSGCRYNNPFYPEAEVVLSSDLQNITLTYEITGGEIKLTYPLLKLFFREKYGGTFAIIDSVRIDYYYSGPPDPVRDSLIGSIPPYTAGFFLYVPPDSVVVTEFNVVTDDVENIFAPDKGDYPGPLNATMTFYGKDGNEHEFELYLTVTLQRVIPD